MMIRRKQIFILSGLIISAVIAFQQGNASKQDNNGDKDKQEYSHGSSWSQRKSYSKALRILWTRVYPNRGNSLYCNQSFSTKNRTERKKQINAEHVFPMAWVAKELNCGKRKSCQRRSAKFREIESDLHNIYPAKININRARGSFRFGDIAGEARQFGTCDFEVNHKNRVVEPANHVRGKVARAMLYMQHQYGLDLHKRTKRLMKKWDKAYPPSKEEKRRAKVIQREQGRENPFIIRYPFTF